MDFVEGFFDSLLILLVVNHYSLERQTNPQRPPHPPVPKDVQKLSR